jgi:hypothetical protein
LLAAQAAKRKDKGIKDELARFIKEDLYRGVKFIYNEKKDLKIGGAIYEYYEKQCKRSIGDHHPPGESCKAYMRSVWEAAMVKHTQTTLLSQKRSAVYTVLQNRFTGKYVETNSVLQNQKWKTNIALFYL